MARPKASTSARYRGDRQQAIAVLQELLEGCWGAGDLTGAAGCLFGLAALLEADGEWESGGRLAGAAEALRRQADGGQPAPEGAAGQQTVSPVRDRRTEATYLRECAAGAAMPAAAVALALRVRVPPRVRSAIRALDDPLPPPAVVWSDLEPVDLVILQGLVDGQSVDELMPHVDLGKSSIYNRIDVLKRRFDAGSAAQLAARAVYAGVVVPSPEPIARWGAVPAGSRVRGRGTSR